MRTGRVIVAVAVTALLATACAGGGNGAVSTQASTAGTTASAPTTVSTTTASEPTRVMVIGDSLALLLGFGLDRRGAAEGFTVDGAGVLGCGILPGESIRYGVRVSTDERCGFVPAMWQAQLDEFHPDVVVVLDGFWDAYDWVIDGVPVEFGTPAWDAFASAHFGAAMDALSAGGRRVVWLLSPYFRPDVVDPAVARYRDEHGEYRSALDDTRVRHLNDLIRDVARSRPCVVQVADTRLCLCPDDTYADTIDGFEVRGDGVHLTDAGADRLADDVIPRVELGSATDC